MMERSIDYRVRILDNIAPAAQGAASAQSALKTQTDAATKSIDSQNISYIKQVAALSAFSRGIGMVSRSLIELHMVNDKQAESLRKMTAGIRLFVGVAQTIKGVIGLVSMLRDAEIGLAVVETYRAVLANPWKMAMVAGAAGTAAGVAGYLIARGDHGGGGGGTTVQQTVNFYNHPADQATRSASRSTIEGVGG